MAKLTKLVTYAYVKEECDLPKHLDNDELDYKIYRAQETLRMLMCDAFYQDFITNYANNTMSDAYNALLPYVQQYIAWQTHQIWLEKANYKVTRGGIRVHIEENSVIATDAQMGPLIKDAKYQSEYYKRIMISYIKDNVTNYPLYCDCTCDSKGNTFHISVIRNRQVAPQPYGTGSYRYHKGCCGHD